MNSECKTKSYNTKSEIITGPPHGFVKLHVGKPLRLACRGMKPWRREKTTMCGPVISPRKETDLS